jgi:predicted amidohydrolase YtcJ
MTGQMTIWHNANGYSMEDAAPRFEAVAVRDGRILAVGSNEEILPLAEDGAKLVDVGGRTVLPGFNDSHLHLLSYGYSLEVADLNDCASIDEMISRIKDYIHRKGLQPDDWIEGRGWDQNLFADKRMPNRHDLDAEFGQYNVVLTRTCAQVSVVTTRVLKAAGILEEPKQVEGGTIQIGEDGRATGILTGLATEIVYRIIPKLGKERIKKAILTACEKYLSAGITSVQTDDFELLRAGSFHDILEAYEELDRENALPLRVNLMLHLATEEELEEFIGLGFRSGDGSPFFRIGPFKMITDGSLGGRTAALRLPYSDDPEAVGEMYLTEEEIETLTRRALTGGLQVVSDGIGDRAMRTVLNVFGRIAEEEPERDFRFGIDHCQITTEGIIEDFARHGIIGGLELVFISSDISIVEARVGKERASQSYNWKRFHDEGVVVAAGSDSPVEEYAPLDGIYAAVTRRDHDGNPESGYNPAEKITVAQAIRAFTVGPAYATFEEGRKGTIAEGRYADMVILENDPFTADSTGLKRLGVWATVVDGRVAYSRQ